ncbi:hypothetical protein TSAR_003518 [Trichomalopsis sarcophagae]|uniref:Uncharacterized protein n=1 Tax=Trichomalopsis sarcophagae TaxID=543379 RepID=A0A232EXP5_9HYME|nr:hypothetical protein TSAR_003518 [Trichomalopsis sarcophagae]
MERKFPLFSLSVERFVDCFFPFSEPSGFQLAFDYWNKK